jgi:hypothetical protein
MSPFTPRGSRLAVFRSLVATLSGLVLASFPACARKESGPPESHVPDLRQDRPPTPAEIAKRTLPAVVAIRVKTPTGEASGTGFVIDPSGTIITNLHVIRGATTVAVKLSNGDVYDQVKVRAFDERKDLAVIQITAFGLPTVPLGNSDSLEPGQRIVLVGNALGVLEGSVSTGVVSGIRTMEQGYKVIQTDAAANHGNSGGPMLNEKGEAVGVVAFKLAEGQAEGLNFAAPINYARGLLPTSDTFPLAELDSRLGKTSSLFSRGESAFPKRWKSLASGTTKILRLDGEHLYVETVLTPEQHQFHMFYLADLKKSGDGYIGTIKSGGTCAYVEEFQNKSNYCRDEVPMGITLLTPSRIEGWTMDYRPRTKFDCGTCQAQATRQKTTFAWIPE